MVKRIVAGAVLVAICLLLVGGTALADNRLRSIRVYAPEADQTEYKVVIESDEDQAWLGVGITTSGDQVKRSDKGDYKLPDGVLITEIYEDSPAERAGLEEGDVIIEFASEKTRNTDNLIDVIDGKKPGDEVEINIIRDGEEQMLIATLASRPEEMLITTGPFTAGLEGLKGLAVLGDLALPWFEIGISGGGRGRLGVYIDDLSEGLAEYFEVPDGRGVLVEDIVDDSPAEKAGIRAGDVIIKVGGMRVSDRGTLVEAISEMEADVETPVVVVRKGEEITLVAIVGENEYERAIREYEKAIEAHAEQLREAKVKSLKMSEQERMNLQEDMEDLREELEDLKEELKELRED